MGKSVLKAFTTSFKHFKNGFFKVGSREEELNFFLDKEGKEKYSLFWQSKPNLLLEVEYGSLDPEDQALANAFTFLPSSNIQSSWNWERTLRLWLNIWVHCHYIFEFCFVSMTALIRILCFRVKGVGLDGGRSGETYGEKKCRGTDCE